MARSDVGVLRAGRTEYRRQRRRVLAAVAPVYAALVAVGALNAVLLVDEADVTSAATAVAIGAGLVVAGVFWTLPGVAAALGGSTPGAATAAVAAPWRARTVAPYRRVNTLSWLLLWSAVALVLLPLVLPARLALALPVASTDGCSARVAMRRSWRLTRGRTWRTWWLLLLTIAVVGAAAGLSLWAGASAAGALDVGERWGFVLALVVSMAVASVPLTLVSARVGVVWMTWHARAAAAVPGPAFEAGGAAPAARSATRPEDARAFAGLRPEATPAGFWRRGLAFALDAALVALVAGGVAGIADAAGNVGGGSTGAVYAGAYALAWLAYAAGLVAWLGQTLGKLAVGVQVVDDAAGARPTLRQALGREAARLGLCLIPLGTVVDHLSALQVARKRTWHDRASGTAVVRRPGG